MTLRVVESIADPDSGADHVRESLCEFVVDVAGSNRMPVRTWPVDGALMGSMQSLAVVDDLAPARGRRTRDVS